MLETEVTVLMAAYNGAPYLNDQIASLRAQSHRRWRLIVRDDGSTDASPDILRERQRQDARIEFLPPDGQRLGPAKSFARLMERSGEAEYLMFCDQDDVWRPQKITLSLSRLLDVESRVGKATPVAVHTDLELVGPRLEPLFPSAKKRMGFDPTAGRVFARLLAQNFVTGCTLLINRALRDAALPLPNEALMHDWWIALVAAARGQVSYLNRPTMAYRQHGQNASGASTPKGFTEGAKDFLSEEAGLRELMGKRFKQCRALERHLAKFPENEASRLLSEFLARLKQNRFTGSIYGMEHGVFMQGFMRSAAYYLLLMKHGYADIED